MTVPALVDLMVRRAEADGAVVVAFFGLARRHLCGRASTLFWGALCLRLWDPLCHPDFSPASTRPAFILTVRALPVPESEEPHRYRPAK